ncbi:MAG: hypothetical protein ACRC14_08125 [Paracoccaceae bacterium]
MTHDPWHFPRPQLARDVLISLTRGPSPAMSLFGARRTGKTAFLQRDLGVAAAEAGHRVVYASFWQNPAAPLAVLLYECDRALHPKAGFGHWVAALPVKARLGWGKSLVEVDFSAKAKAPPEDQVMLLDAYLERLATPRTPAILMLDEVQELAAHAQGPVIMAALRTGLDKRRDGIRTVFTGSSQLGLNRVFSAREAPFYRFATPLTLPPLDESFVDHQREAFRATYRRKLSRDVALQAFERFKGNPFIFQQWLIALGMNQGLTESDAEAQVLCDLAAELGFDRVWLGLSTEQRAVARLLAERAQGIFGGAVEARLVNLIGAAPAPSVRQTAIRLLQRQGQADQFDKEWRLADPLFEAWVLERPADEF